MEKYEYKKHHICEKEYVLNHAKCSRQNGKYLNGKYYR